MSAPLPDWPDQPNVPDFIGVDELTTYLKDLGITENAIRCFDDPYDTIIPQWVHDFVIPVWKDTIERYKLRGIGYDSQDCDDFARGCAWIAQVVHNQRQPGNAAAFFECAYNMTGTGEHAIVGCIWRIPDSRLLKIAFFEPQPTMVNSGFVIEVLKEMNLSPDEISSITDIRF